MILSIIGWIMLVLFISIIFHEFGHWAYARYKLDYNMNPEWFFDSWLSWGVEMTYPLHINDDKRLNLYLSGIVVGLIPVMVAILFTQYRYFIFALPIYMAGCRSDLHKLIDIVRRKGDI